MSLLLDALNKAEQERKRNLASPGIHSNHDTAQENLRSKSIMLVTAIVIGCLLLAGIYWFAREPATQPPIAALQQPVDQSIKDAKVDASAATKNISQQTAINNLAETDSSTTSTTNSAAANSPSEPDMSEENVADLYQQNTATQTANATLTLSEPSPDLAPPTNVNAPATNTSLNSVNQFANLPDLHDLPSQVLEKIPSLNYSEHNYNNSGGSVKVNGNIHHANDQLANGLVIDRILEDGMILHVDNYVFKMRALNSWVNM